MCGLVKNIPFILEEVTVLLQVYVTEKTHVRYYSDSFLIPLPKVKWSMIRKGIRL